MPDADEEIVTFRLPPRDRDAISRLVERGAFQNRSDFLRHAVRTTLREHEAKPKLNLDLEGVDLAPPEPAPRGRGRAGRSRRGLS